MPIYLDVRVFVSSTRKDLSPRTTDDFTNLLMNFRQSAIEAVGIAGGVPVEMSSWVAPFGSPVEICRQKVQLDSSHYLGIFAFRRGFEPPEIAGKSITEAEFEWACGSKKPMIVFLPEPTSPIGLRLKALSNDETEAQQQAQQAFLDRIQSLGVCLPFRSHGELASKVAVQVVTWKAGGLDELAALEQPETEDVLTAPPPVGEVGRRAHCGRFNVTLAELDVYNLPRIAAFLIHGADGFGHDELAAQLRNCLRTPGRVDPEYVLINIKPIWRENSIARFLDVLGMGSTPQTVASQLDAKLARNDVVLDIRDLHRFDGSLPAFIKAFWSEVALSLKKTSPFRLVVLFGVGKSAPTEWDAILQTQPLAADFDAARPIKLPELDAFSESDLKTWLTGKVPNAEIEPWAKTLIEETGGKPQSVYHKLNTYFG